MPEWLLDPKKAEPQTQPPRCQAKPRNKDIAPSFSRCLLLPPGPHCSQKMGLVAVVPLCGQTPCYHTHPSISTPDLGKMLNRLACDRRSRAWPLFGQVATPKGTK